MAQLIYNSSVHEGISSTGSTNTTELYHWFDLNKASAWLRSNGLGANDTITSAYVTAYVKSSAQNSFQFQASLYDANKSNPSGLKIETSLDTNDDGKYHSAQSKDLVGDMNSSNVGYFSRPWLRIYTYYYTWITQTWDIYYTLTVNFTPHSHSYTSTVTTQPSCTTTGVKTYTCSCDSSYTEVMPALGHSYVEILTAPTCTAQGYTTHTCSCGHSYVDTYVAAKGHTEVTIPAVAPTCTTTGLTEGKKCSVCGVITVAQTTIPAKGHTWVDATCTAPKTCSVCGATEGSALGHNYVPTEVSPTEDSHGYTRYDCTRCGHNYIDENSYTYLVRWYNEDGSELLETDPSVPYGTMPEYNGVTPTKAATAQYTFEHFGWNISPSADGKIELTPVVANVKYYARFKSNTIWYQVEWLNEDGTVLQGADWTPYGNQPSYDGPPPTKPDSSDGKYRYEFLGWSVKDVDDGHYDESDLEPVTGHITYEAVYLPIVKQYSLTLIADDCTVDIEINSVPAEGNIDGDYDYGTFFAVTIKKPDVGYKVSGFRFIDGDGNVNSIDGDTIGFMLTKDLIVKCICERLPSPFFISPEQQVQMVYIVPAINTIVYQVEGDLPTLETKMQSVDDFRFDVINTDIDEKYGLYAYYEVEQLYINKENQPAERVW